MAQLRSIGVAEGGVLLVHTSFRAVRPIEGGPLDLVEALGLQFEGLVGRAHARLARSRDIVAAAVESLRTDPLLFLHAPGVGCAECDEARASVHGPE